MRTRRDFLTTGSAAVAGAAFPGSVPAAQDNPASRKASSGMTTLLQPIPTVMGSILPDQMGIISLHEQITLRTRPKFAAIIDI